MKISENGINLIANFEGLQCKAYRCPAGVLTIGIGETGKFALTGKPITKDMCITQQQAKDSFRIAIKRYEDAVNELGVDLNQNQFDALVSFCYNLGTGIFTGNLLNAIKAKNWSSVASQMLLYNKARVNGKLTVLNGLDRRRKAEVGLFKKVSTISKLETLEHDEELYQACRKIILSGIKIEINKWKRTDLINLKNVPMLLVKLGGVNKLVEDKVISNKEIWLTAQYNANHVRALLIKYSKMLG